MNIRTFVAILSRNLQYDFPKMRGGGQRPFGIFPKIHPFWWGHPSLTVVTIKTNVTIVTQVGDGADYRSLLESLMEMSVDNLGDLEDGKQFLLRSW